MPKIIQGHKFTKDNQVVADETLKEKGFKVGDQLSLSQSDEKLKLSALVKAQNIMLLLFYFQIIIHFKKSILK